MKKFLSLLIIFFCCKCYAADFSAYCLNETEMPVNKNVFEKINSVPKKAIETGLEKDLKKQFHSDFKIDIDMFDLTRLKQGELKRLSIASKSLQYDGMSVSDFYAATICNYNKVIYKRGRIYYPYPMPMAFTAKITNQDLEYIVNSEMFNDKVLSNGIKINGQTIFSFEKPKITIENSKVYLSIPVKPVFMKKSFKVKLYADAVVEDNNILLKNISFTPKSNIMVMDVADYFGKNPVSITNSALNGKFCKIYILKAKIDGNIIKAEGVFVINKNYGG